MKQNMHNNVSNLEKFSSAKLTETIQEKGFEPDNMAQRNEELQQQTRYVNRVLEAYGDCV